MVKLSDIPRGKDKKREFFHSLTVSERFNLAMQMIERRYRKVPKMDRTVGRLYTRENGKLKLVKVFSKKKKNNSCNS